MSIDKDNAESQARAQLRSIVEMIGELVCAETTNDQPKIEEVDERIYQDPLSVEVRSGWQRVGETLLPDQFRILLCTGGPAVQIRGDLDEYNEPMKPFIEYQDWFTPWTRLHDISDEDQEALERYCRHFHFGY